MKEHIDSKQFDLEYRGEHQPMILQRIDLSLSLLQKKRVTISDYSCSSGNWTRTSDLRVMSPTSYLLLYPAI